MLNILNESIIEDLKFIKELIENLLNIEEYTFKAYKEMREELEKKYNIEYQEMKKEYEKDYIIGNVKSLADLINNRLDYILMLNRFYK